MLKYHSTYIGFREIPDEISLCINITNCPNNCKGCHSPWLLEDVGTPLTYTELKKLIYNNDGITCVCFMGGDREYWEVVRLVKLINEDYPKLKTAWYSGKDRDTKEFIGILNYIKLGPYIIEKGPLDFVSTNQRLYALHKFPNKAELTLDITERFWKND